MWRKKTRGVDPTKDTSAEITIVLRGANAREAAYQIADTARKKMNAPVKIRCYWGEWVVIVSPIVFQDLPRIE